MNQVIDCSLLDVDSVCKTITKYPAVVMGAYQILADQVSKKQCNVFSFLDGESWGRSQYFIVGVGNIVSNNKTKAVTVPGDNEKREFELVTRIFIPISVHELVDVAVLSECVTSFESVYDNVEVFAAFYELADNIM